MSYFKHQVAVVTADNEAFLGFLVGQMHAEDVEFIQISHHTHLCGRQLSGAVILDNYTNEIEMALVPTVFAFNGEIQDMRPDAD